MRFPLLLLAIFSTYVPVQAGPGSELVLSEDFEHGRESWRPASVGSIDFGQQHKGAGLKLNDSDTARYFTTMRTISVKSDSRYEVSFWCFTRDARRASLCLAQRTKEGRPATSDGKRLTDWCFPFGGGNQVGQWIETKRIIATGPQTDRISVILNPADGSKRHTGTAWYDDITLRYIGRTIPPAESNLPLKILLPLELDLGSGDCTILCPKLDQLQVAARSLAAAIEAKTRHAPRLLDDTVNLQTLGQGPVLVMGNLVVSALGKKLYFEGYDFTDYAWPGRGGHVVRTIRDPFGTGANVLMIGGSHPEDIVRAAARTEEIVATRERKLGYINDVRLGENGDLIASWSSEFLKDDAKWKRDGSLGSWEYLWQIGRAGMGYLRTGDEAYLRPFQRELLYFLEHDVLDRKQEAPPQIHSVIDAALLPWDLLADHPFFSAEDRRDLDEKFLILACSREGPRTQKNAGWELRGNHGLGKALDGFWLGRYFQRRYRVEEAGEWLGIVDRYFAPQLQSSKPLEDGGYHQYKASLLCTLMYALAAGKQDYIAGRALRDATDRAVLEYDIGQGPMAYLGARAVSANDPGYLSLMVSAGRDEYIRQCAAMRYGSLLGENLRSFCGFQTPQEKKELLGVKAAPLDPMWHARLKRQTGNSPFVLTTGPEESYDKLVIRDSYDPNGFYLKIDGLGTGSHSFQDANCITAYRDRGVPWLFEEYGYKGPACSTLRQQNGVFIALNGQGPHGVNVCAKLLYARKLADDLDALGGALVGPGEVDWQRHLLRRVEAWTLVIDRAIAKQRGELFVERHWHIRPWGRPREVFVKDGTAICRHGDAFFRLQSAGLAPEAITGTSNRKEVVRADLPAHGHVEIASLIYVYGNADENRFRLEQTADGWRVNDVTDGSTVGVAIGQSGLEVSTAAARAAAVPPPKTLSRKRTVPAIELPWRDVPMGEEVTAVAAGPNRFAAGTRNGTVAVFAIDGTRRWQAKVGAPTLSLHFFKGGLLQGGDDGVIHRYDASGKQLWSVAIPYVHIGWPHWSDGRSRIRELSSADINGDGEQEILVSNGDRRLYALTASGQVLWKKGVRWGVPIALTPTTYQDRFALFSGVTGPTLAGRVRIHDAQANAIGLKIPHQNSQQIRDLRLFDLTGNNEREIIVARSTSSNQLAVCNQDRSLLWEADVGGSADALAIRRHRGATQVLCGSQCGYLHAFDGATGKQQWFCYLGDEPRMLWPLAEGSILVSCPSGNVFVVADEGTLVGRQRLPAPVTALLRPGEHRVSPSCVPLGTANGTVYILSPEPQH